MSNNFSMNAGETKYLEIPVFESDGVTPKDISSADAIWVLSRSNTGVGKTALVTCEVNDGSIVLTNTASNGLTVILIPYDTHDMNGSHYHECRVTIDSVQEVVASGTATIEGTTTYGV